MRSKEIFPLEPIGPQIQRALDVEAELNRYATETTVQLKVA